VTSIPATVTIIDLPAGTTPTGVELIEGVQTSGGVANSVKFTLTQVVGSLGGLPTGGGTGQLLGSLGTGFSASWITLSSVVTASTGISVVGSTTLVLALATAGGPSVLGVAGVATANPLPIVGAAAQVLRVNDGGTGVAFGAVNLGSAAAVTGVLPGANYSAVNLAAAGAGGVQGALPLTSITTIPALSVLGNASSAITNATALVGTANQLLAVNAAATTILFRSVSSYIDSAVGSSQGAILYRNAASWVILPAGSTGQLLQTLGAAANPQWAGGMVLLNTLSPNNVATTGDTTSLTSTYRHYMVMFDNIVPSVATGATLLMQVATSGTTFIATSYVGGINVPGVAVMTTATTMLLSGVTLTSNVGNGTTFGVNGFIKIFNPAATTFNKSIVGLTDWMNGTTPGTGTSFLQGAVFGSFIGTTSPVTGLQFSFGAGNIQTGTIRIYGIA
jgi:hypothetical protein